MEFDDVEFEITELELHVPLFGCSILSLKGILWAKLMYS